MKTKGLLMLGFFIFPVILSAQTNFRSGIFLHHSTGRNIWGPNGSSTSVPDEITKYNADHGYSGEKECSLDEEWFPDNHGNEWYDWHQLFDSAYTDDDIWPFISSNRIVVIKSCFPSSKMTGWGDPADTTNPSLKSVYNYKWHWRHILKIMEKHPENFFIVWTNAPLVAGATNDDQAYWSNVFCTWAKDTLAEGLDPEYGVFPKNVYIFDFFHKLVGDDYKLKAEYANSSTDSHPNSAATELVAPQFVKEVFDAAIRYESFYNGTLQPPDLISPVNNSDNVSLDTTLLWHNQANAEKYHIQVSESQDFPALLVDDYIADTAFIFGNELTENTTYYWRVRSVSNSDTSVWSQVWSFETISSTGIHYKRINMGISIYPNPTFGKITVKFTNPIPGGYAELFEITGKLLRKIYLPGNKEINLDFTDLDRGIYVLKLNEGEKVFKLIIK